MTARTELLLAGIGILITCTAGSLAGWSYSELALDPSQSIALRVEAVAFFVVVLGLLYGNLVYQLARYGYWWRRDRHASGPSLPPCVASRTAIPSVAILIPSYREEIHILRQTILSAALAEHANRHLIVLLDDPPVGTPRQLAALEAARQMIRDLDAIFAECAEQIETRVARLRRLNHPADRTRAIAAEYEAIADRLDDWAAEAEAGSRQALAHGDRLFVEKILRAPTAAHRRHASEIRERGDLNEARLIVEEERLTALFRVPITSFERKQYANLSHCPNKAMNLNAYIGLMGHSFRKVDSRIGLSRLEACDRQSADVEIPAADYVLTLDADSLILPEYMLRLVPIMESEPRLAVAQTPYSAAPGAPGQLERIAGATTDVQHIIHQGFTCYGATFWVGANALLRLRALQDIAVTVEERGFRVPVFIQDRTVIEDTGSTIDLVRRGWKLHNHQERLAYSATPPDFGSLIIQRQRWSNGGLIILPDLLRYARELPRRCSSVVELLVRANYLTSPALGSVGLLALLFFPFDSSITSAWLPVSALPYYYLYGRDLTQCGYRWSDLPRVYALNLLLLPVNLAGMTLSVWQILTGRKAAFGRTPKIEGRTATPLCHALIQVCLLSSVVILCAVDAWMGRFLHAAFSLVNASFWLYGLYRLIGWGSLWQDLRAGILQRLDPALGQAQAIGRAQSGVGAP
jgi:cellulose synthase/poly-beta-1,6-N-acetylglucosamine synthase-like glycosyltransferase